MEGMLTELRKAVEMIANPVAELRSAVEMITKKQDAGLGEGPGADKADIEALYARPTGSPEDLAQAPNGSTGMLGRIRELSPEESNLKLRHRTWMVCTHYRVDAGVGGEAQCRDQT